MRPKLLKNVKIDIHLFDPSLLFNSTPKFTDFYIKGTILSIQTALLCWVEILQTVSIKLLLENRMEEKVIRNILYKIKYIKLSVSSTLQKQNHRFITWFV